MPSHRKPWPMKWIVIAILVIIVPYTYLTLHYRKPGPAFRPYEDTKKRAITGRLLSAGYQRVTLEARRPSDSASGEAMARGASAATILFGPGGVAADLKDALIDSPILPLTIDRVVAAGSARAGQAYVIQFTCSLPDTKAQLTDAHLYRKDDDFILVPTFEKLAGGLQARTTESTVVLTLPPSVIQPGSYNVVLAGSRSSRKWTLQVH